MKDCILVNHREGEINTEFAFSERAEFPLLSMPEVYGRPRGAVNNHEKQQRSALEENVGTRNPAAPAKRR
jgi:hypothetical protein